MIAAAELITTDPDLLSLRAEWAALWRRAPQATPFQSPDWLLPWWRQFGTARPVVAAVRGESDQLLGLLPAYVLQEQAAAKLLPIGAGSSDYLDALIDPAAPPDTATRLLEAVLHGAGPIARCDLIDLPPGSPLRQASAPTGWTRTLSDTTPCPVLTLPDSVAGLEQVIPAHTRRKLRMNRNRGARAGGWIVTLATADSAAESLAWVNRLHEARWTARGEPGGVLADPRVAALLQEAVPRLLAAGAVWLATLRLDAQIAAACLAFASRDRLYLYLSGFDSARAFESPGTLLLGDLVEAAVRAGLREVHFLRGAEPYKYAWAAVDRFNATLSLRPA